MRPSRRSCSATTSAFERRWNSSEACCQSHPPQPPGRATSQRGSTRSGAGLDHGDRLAAPEPVALAGLGEQHVRPAHLAGRAGRRRRGPRAAPRSGRRAPPPDPQPDDAVAGRVAAAVAVPAGARPGARVAGPGGRRPPPAVASPRAGPQLRGLLLAEPAAGGEPVLAVLQARRRQLPRDARDHHPRRVVQPGLEPQRALVVQELLPPVADDVLGHEDDDEVARAVPPHAPDVVDDRAGDLPVRGVEHPQRHGQVARLPLLLQPLRLLRVDPDRERLDDGRPRGPRVGECPQRRLVQLADQDDGVHAGRAARAPSGPSRWRARAGPGGSAGGCASMRAKSSAIASRAR